MREEPLGAAEPQAPIAADQGEGAVWHRICRSRRPFLVIPILEAMRRVGALHWSPHASYAFERVPIFSFQQLHIPIPQPAEAAEEHSAPHRLRASCYSSRRSYTSMSSMQTASRKFHATAATQDPIAQLSAIFGDTVAKQIAEKNKLALRVVDIPGKFAVLVEAMGGGTTGENRAKKIVLQNITVLDSPILDRFYTYPTPSDSGNITPSNPITPPY